VGLEDHRRDLKEGRAVAVVTVQIGHNVRRYVTFEIKDATPDEILLLRDAEQNDWQPEVYALLSSMDEAGRLTEVEEDYEDGPEVFSEHAEPNIIGVEDDQ
jgi:hypothetical protein